MKMNSTNERFIKLTIILAYSIGIILLAIIGSGVITKGCNRTSTEQEIIIDNKGIDSLKEENSIKLNDVKFLDSIKNEDIENIKSLDNDSTLKLFYKLIGKR